MFPFPPEGRLVGAPSVVSGQFAGRYTIERELGRGGSAVVYLAHDQDSSSLVAIKVLRQELTEGLADDRFLREIRVTQSLRHPNIIPVLDSGNDGGRLYCVLPYMSGGTLRDRLRDDKQLPIDQVIEIGVTIARALAHAHRENFLHRDVKPENILISESGIYLSDFGIARAMHRAAAESTTSTGIVRGTPAYLSPEQAAGDHDLDARSDIYSLACVLYEALAGVPAFVGATSAAIVAQRIVHSPRPIGVYRPSVSPELEAVLAKALATARSDRFQTADEFADALTRPPFVTRPTPASRINSRPRFIALGLAASVAVAALAVWGREIPRWFAPAAVTDTTKIALLPLEAQDAAWASQVYDVLYDRLSSWRGITPVDRFLVRESVRRPGGLSSDDEARRLATKLGAGRYIRAGLSPTGSGWRLDAALYDVRTRKRIYGAAGLFSIGQRDSVVGGLADTLVLQGIPSSMAGSRTLPAVQSFARAQRLISEEWNLRSADSLLERAVEADPQFASASLWLAEVRAAQLRRAQTWRAAAERAAATPGLSQRESLLANALVALAREEYPRSCDWFDRMRRADTTDFIAWYGLGQCRRMDPVVVPDPRSPSGWSFRSSMYQSTLAFARAFSIAPTLHRGVEEGGYQMLRKLLWTNEFTALVGFAGTNDSLRFLAQPNWRGDSLSFIPYRTDAQAAAKSESNAAMRRAAFMHQRALFAEIARIWAGALPNSSGTKEALAIALEMSNNAAAVDTIRAARRLVTDDLARTRLTAQEIFLRLEFSRPDNPNDVSTVRAMADSLLGRPGDSTQERSAVLAPVAALLGRCTTAAHLAARANSEGAGSDAAAMDSIGVLLAAGCDGTIPPPLVRRLLSRTRKTQLVSTADTLRAEYEAIGRETSLAFPNQSQWLDRLAESSGDYLLRAEHAAFAHDTTNVRVILSRQLGRRGNGVTNVSPDARLLEAEVWLAIGDSTQTRVWLTPLLARSTWSTSVAYDAVSVASVLRGLVLLSKVSPTNHDDIRLVSQWTATVAALWSAADPPLKRVADQLRGGKS